jgi:rhamnosyltransferase subunit B
MSTNATTAPVRRSNPRFVFSVCGTAGDAYPLIAIAGELAARGYACHLLSNAPFESLALSRGVGFTAIAPQQENNLTSVEHNFGTYLFPSYERTFRYFEREVERTDSVVVVNTDNYSASNSLAELYDLPICRAHVTPFTIRSWLDPACPWKQQARGPLGQTFLKYLLPRLYKTWDTYPFVLACLNEHRRRWGLPEVESLRHSEQRIRKRLALFPRWYRVPAPDWPENLEFHGFPLPKSTGPLPQQLSSFIESQGRPLVFTPGTGVPDVETFFAQAQQCCELLQMPGVFLSRHAKRAPSAYGSRVLQLDYVDLELVLASAALLVHHGGMGTTARALQAGIPQIISPMAYDQPDNGWCVSQLAAGCVIERRQLSGQTLAEAASRLLESEPTRAALGQTREWLATEGDAASSIADSLEHAFAASRRPRRVSTNSAAARGLL